ncbi:MAG: hypothetical protein BWX71_01955 [Deltaproteobacteria bacterium ADurb.Bin072]|nr:MAG: hypothetical protein BWX71_01955 [Deltaproteobacteria bacterium ADurb.Bin072]
MGDRPSTAAFSRSLRSILAKAALSGCTAKGRLYTMEAITMPVKVKSREEPVRPCHAAPSVPFGPMTTRR